MQKTCVVYDFEQAHYWDTQVQKAIKHIQVTPNSHWMLGAYIAWAQHCIDQYMDAIQGVTHD